MLSLANRSRPLSARLQRTYRIEMGGRTLLVSLGLACLTGLVIFYMGVITGKGARVAEPVSVMPAGESGGSAGDAESEEGLAFNEALMEREPVVEDLFRSEAETSAKSEELIARANRELTVEEVPIPRAAPETREPQAPAQPAAPRAEAPREPAAARAPAPSQPANPPAAAGERYTVQVASSQNRASAAALADKLKGMGFDAYLNQFQDREGNVWYRVRVGNTSRDEAERLQASLRRRAKVEAAQVIQL